MLRITLDVKAPEDQAIGIKEDLAMYFEQYGDTQVISIEKIAPEQMRLEGKK